MTKQQFVAARDLLLVKFAMETGTRPGPLNNATLKDYGTADIYDGKQILLVPKHKRSEDGPAMLGMDKELQEQMAVYI